MDIHKSAVLFLIMMTTSTRHHVTAETISECQHNAGSWPGHITSLSSHTHYSNQTLNNTMYTIHKTSNYVNWCQSYHMCINKGQKLVTIQRREVQEFLESSVLNRDEVSGYVWLGSRRKDYGAEWTWINESLEDCSASQCGHLTDIQNDSKPYIQYFRRPGSILSTHLSVHGPDTLRYFTCATDDTAYMYEAEVTWYDAQTYCSSAGSRLSTLEEFSAQAISGTHTYWIGLFYKPWIWISSTMSENEATTYFKTSLTRRMSDEAGCLVLSLVDNTWAPAKCSDRITSTVICEHAKASTGEFTVIDQTDLDLKTTTSITTSSDVTFADTRMPDAIPVNTEAYDVTVLSADTDDTTAADDVTSSTEQGGAEADDSFHRVTLYLMVTGLGSFLSCIIIFAFVFGFKTGSRKRQREQVIVPRLDTIQESQDTHIDTHQPSIAAGYPDPVIVEDPCADYDVIRDSFIQQRAQPAQVELWDKTGHFQKAPIPAKRKFPGKPIDQARSCVDLRGFPDEESHMTSYSDRNISTMVALEGSRKCPVYLYTDTPPAGVDYMREDYLTTVNVNPRSRDV